MIVAPPADIKTTLTLLPDAPGVYQYFSSEGELIYVGKAKNLKRRVNSYFNKDQTGKVLALVRRVARLEYIVVDTEFDALLLENNLIKEHKPHYNILLKDDKTYPWLCLTKEPYPRLFPTRRYLPEQGTYFGPYASVRMMHTLLDLIHDMFPLRNCRHRLSDSVVAGGKVKLCLQYQMKRCAGPCQGLQSHEAYSEQIDQIKNLLRGHIKPLLQNLKEKMLEAAARQDFKTAQQYKEKWQLLEQYQSRSAIVSDKLADVDVLQVKEKDNFIYFNYMRIVDGLMVQAHTIELRKKLDETPQDLWQSVLVDFRQRYASTAKEVILPFAPEWDMPGLKITVPKTGDGKKLLDLSARNIDYFILEKSRRMDLVDPDRHHRRLLSEMQSVLGMKEPPTHIECFDNSNMLGEYPVSAMTVSKDGKLSKRDYRHFLVRTVEGPNDYASMEEIIDRRYSRLLREEQPLPQLVIVDGGKGQLSSAYKVLSRLGLERRIFLIGIAENLEEIYKVGDPYPLLLDKKSEVLKHIQLLRDEAHRFGITHYRKRHVKGVVKTELTEIKGIGRETAQTLLRQFKSVKQIRQTPLEELTAAIGAAKARLVFDYFKTENEPTETFAQADRTPHDPPAALQDSKQTPDLQIYYRFFDIKSTTDSALDSTEPTSGSRSVTSSALRKAVHDWARQQLQTACTEQGLGTLPPLQYGPHGKPHLGADHPLHFNLSHSGSGGALAISKQPVGLDIECNDGRHWKRLSERFFSPEERAFLNARPAAERPQVFVFLWTCKESLYKYIGCGLAQGLSHYTLQFDGTDAQNDYQKVRASYEARTLYFNTLLLRHQEKDYRLTICSPLPEATLYWKPF